MDNSDKSPLETEFRRICGFIRCKVFILRPVLWCFLTADQRFPLCIKESACSHQTALMTGLLPSVCVCVCAWRFTCYQGWSACTTAALWELCVCVCARSCCIITKIIKLWSLSVPLPWVLLEIWGSIFVPSQTSNLRTARKQFTSRPKRNREDWKWRSSVSLEGKPTDSGFSETTEKVSERWFMKLKTLCPLCVRLQENDYLQECLEVVQQEFMIFNRER